MFIIIIIELSIILVMKEYNTSVSNQKEHVRIER